MENIQGLLLLQVATISSENINDLANNWKNVGALAAIILLIVIVAIFVISFVLKGIFANTDTIQFGKFKIHSKNKPINANNQSPETDPGQLIDSFDFVIKVKNREMVDKILKIKDEIIELEKDYDNRVDALFHKVYKSIEADLHEKLVSVICATLNFDIQRTKSTREYFFITELLKDYRDSWIKTAKDIIRHNGFVSFLEDKSKCKGYINELTNCMYECLDINKMESTVIKKSQIDDAMTDSSNLATQSLERMFMSLAEMKLTMVNKRADKICEIENLIEANRVEILAEIKNKLIGKQEETDQVNTTNENA